MALCADAGADEALWTTAWAFASLSTAISFGGADAKTALSTIGIGFTGFAERCCGGGILLIAFAIHAGKAGAAICIAGAGAAVKVDQRLKPAHIRIDAKRGGGPVASGLSVPNGASLNVRIHAHNAHHAVDGVKRRAARIAATDAHIFFEIIKAIAVHANDGDICTVFLIGGNNAGSRLDQAVAEEGKVTTDPATIEGGGVDGERWSDGHVARKDQDADIVIEAASASPLRVVLHTLHEEVIAAKGDARRHIDAKIDLAALAAIAFCGVDAVGGCDDKLWGDQRPSTKAVALIDHHRANRRVTQVGFPANYSLGDLTEGFFGGGARRLHFTGKRRQKEQGKKEKSGEFLRKHRLLILALRNSLLPSQAGSVEGLRSHQETMGAGAWGGWGHRSTGRGAALS